MGAGLPGGGEGRGCRGVWEGGWSLGPCRVRQGGISAQYVRVHSSAQERYGYTCYITQVLRLLYSMVAGGGGGRGCSVGVSGEAGGRRGELDDQEPSLFRMCAIVQEGRSATSSHATSLR